MFDGRDPIYVQIADRIRADVAEGVLVKQRGIGMFVADGARERLLAVRRARYFDDVLVPALAEARRIGIDGDELLERVRAEGGRVGRAVLVVVVDGGVAEGRLSKHGVGGGGVHRREGVEDQNAGVAGVRDENLVAVRRDRVRVAEAGRRRSRRPMGWRTWGRCPRSVSCATTTPSQRQVEGGSSCTARTMRVRSSGWRHGVPRTGGRFGGVAAVRHHDDGWSDALSHFVDGLHDVFAQFGTVTTRRMFGGHGVGVLAMTR